MNYQNFQFSHARRDDGRLVGILLHPSDSGKVVYAYTANGQSYERSRTEFFQLFRTI